MISDFPSTSGSVRPNIFMHIHLMPLYIKSLVIANNKSKADYTFKNRKKKKNIYEKRSIYSKYF